MSSIYVEVKSLPQIIQRTLLTANYKRVDVEVKEACTYREQILPFEGNRGYCAVVDLDQEKTGFNVGSWGGPNMFNPNNQVDRDDENRTILPGHMIVKGEWGGRGSFASVLVRLEDFQKLQPKTSEELGEDERKALALFGLKGGKYRKEAAEREGIVYSFKSPLFSSLIKRGYVKANKSGAMSITTKGRNARLRK